MRSAAVTLLLACFARLALAGPPPDIAARSWLLADLTSRQVIAGHRADDRAEPASLTKLMTAYLAFEAMRDGLLPPDRRIPVPPRVLKVPGSRMFIQPDLSVTTDELLRGLVVDSGNDAAIALAKALAGTENAFVGRMNREAARLGMRDTHFANATGLPDPDHYSTAYDLYLLATALMRDFPDRYAEYFAEKKFRYNDITQWNRNRLLWMDPSVDGVKTGHTETAGYCLVASSKRGGRRLLSVLLGANSESARAQESLRLLNWGFQAFDSVRLFDRGQTVKMIDVWKGASDQVRAGLSGGLTVTVPRGAANQLRAVLLSKPPLVAPVTAGERIGELRLTLDGKLFGEYPVVALESVGQAGLLGRAWDTLRLWIN